VCSSSAACAETISSATGTGMFPSSEEALAALARECVGVLAFPLGEDASLSFSGDCRRDSSEKKHNL